MDICFSDRPLDAAFRIFSGNGFPFVMEAFALGKRQVHFAFAVFPVQAQGHQSITFFLDFPGQSYDFPFVQKQFADAQGIMVEAVALFVWADMHAVEKHLTVFDSGEAVPDIDLTQAQGFNFSTF